MRRRFLAMLLIFCWAGCGNGPNPPALQTTIEADNQIVEAACGQCQFGMEAPGCDLAVRIDGRAYFVDGTGIDDHGNSHADDGFCNAVREAKVTGHIEDGRFKSKAFALIPSED